MNNEYIKEKLEAIKNITDPEELRIWNLDVHMMLYNDLITYDEYMYILEHAEYTKEAEAIMEKYDTEENDSVKGRK